MAQAHVFKVSSSPHIRSGENTQSVMLDVVLALLPALAVAIILFGLRALALTGVSVAASVFFEWAYRKLMKKDSSIGDCSAVVTGMLLAYCLPPSAPYWIAVVGALFAIVIVKQLYGGIGKNFVNPALAARAFLFSWPVIMTTWTLPKTFSNIFNIFEGSADAVTGATPMAALHAGTLPDASLMNMFLGNTGGCLGEISALALLAGGVYLLARRVITPRIPASFILTVAALTFVFPKGGNSSLDWMLYNLFGGGLMLGAIFMATDYSTSPITPWGQIFFGIGCGLITVFIRYFGAYVEGVSYAILIMNICVWLLDRATHPRRFGVSAQDRKNARQKQREEKKKAREGAAV